MIDDKFQLLKSKYLERVRSKERELIELKEKIRLIQELEAEANAEPSGHVETDNSKYKDVGLTEAIIDTLGILGASEWVSAAAVRQHLLSQGFQPEGKHFAVSVGTTLKRLSKAKRIQTKSEEGNRLYMANKQT